MSHRHYCDFAGHDWQCSEDCECICGLLMEGNDHSECPVELRACPEHTAEQQRSIDGSDGFRARPRVRAEVARAAQLRVRLCRG